MNPSKNLHRRLDTSNLLEVLIRAAFILATALLCYRAFSPFLELTVWAVILAVTLYPVHQFLASKLGGRQGLAAVALVLLGILLIVVPAAVLMSSLGDSVHQLIKDVQTNSLEVPPPPDSVAAWPFVGEKAHALWSQAHADLPALVQSLQPKIGDLARSAVGFVASIGGGLLLFLTSFIVAGIIMAYGAAAGRGCLAIFQRIAGKERGAEFTELSTAPSAPSRRA